MKQRILFELIFKTTAYAIFFIGLWVILQPLILPSLNQQIRKYKTFTRLRKLHLKKNMSMFRSRFFIYRHLELLLGSTWPWYSESTIIYYIILSIVLFSVSTATYFRFISGWRLSIIFGLVTASFPYFFLLLRLFWKRSETSYELVPAATILLGKYRVNSRNIYYSIIDTIKEISQYRALQKTFIKLASAIQSHRSKEDLEEALELFVYQIGTTWAQQLGVLILNAQWDGKDIERSLSNIVKDIGKAQEILEQEKSSNQDTIQMGYFVPIIAFPASLCLLSKVVSPGRFLYYQLKTTVGFTSFIITSILCIGGFMVSLLLKKPKNEI
ncbi:MAG: hypothetical protein CVV03_07270 [Firmicutes bacterium HGW-Firmicutes-8]|nr:MAG: hypothetical protein CVV03_07270 [Firmicutes bacterium HGW-Firmicutes-8]